MHFTKAFVLFAATMVPVAFAAETATSPAVTKTLTLVPPGYTPTPTPTSTMTPSSTSTPVSTSTPCFSSSSFNYSLIPSSTPLIKPTSTAVVVVPTTQSNAPAPASTSAPASGAGSRHLPGAVAAGAMAVAGFLLV